MTQTKKPFAGIIPCKFNIGGVEYNVNITRNEINFNNFGNTHPFEAQITIQTEMDRKPIARTQQVQTFWHEVVHTILDAMGEKQESEENERFTTCFSNFLNEVMQSCEIEIEEDKI